MIAAGISKLNLILLKAGALLVVLGACNPSTALPTPGGFKAQVNSSTQINLSWQAVLGANGYSLERKTGSGEFKLLQSNLSSTNYSDTGLSPSTQYSYRLRARSSTRESSAAEISATTEAIPLPTIPGSFAAKPISISQIDLSWSAATGASSYVLERKSGTAPFALVKDDLTATTYSDTGLSAETLYQYRLRAKNQGGTSTAVEASATTFTPLPQPPANPSEFVAQVVSMSEIKLSWQAVLGANSYSLERKTGSTEYQVLFAQAVVTNYSDSGLTPGTLYTYRLKAKNLGGESSGVEVLATTPSTPPPPLTGLAAEAISSSQIYLSWDEILSSDRYTVERKTDNAAYTLIAEDLDAPPYTDTNLSPSTSYTYRVKAIGSFGETSAEVSATTLAGTSPPPPPPPPPPTDLKPLNIYSTNRHFASDGKPLYLLADTAWGLFSRLTPTEVQDYLNNRAALGFNAILAPILWEFDWKGPSVGGHYPFALIYPNASDERFKGRDISQPNAAFFANVDQVIDQANALGLYVGIQPAWNNHLGGPFGWQVPNTFAETTSKQYGRFLGSRYKDKKVFWIMGGDDPLDEDQNPCLTEPHPGFRCTTWDERKLLYRLIAEGIREMVGSAQLITFHPGGAAGTASSRLLGETWLDFHSQQSGTNVDYFPSLTHQEYNLSPTRPVFEMEPVYEDFPFAGNPANGFSTPDQVRRIAYWNAMAGTAGHTYGHQSIWQFCAVLAGCIIPAKITWRDALNATAATQMKHLRKLMESRPFTQGTPAQNLLEGYTDPVGDGGVELQRLRALKGNNFALIYFPTPRTNFPINLNQIQSAGPFVAWWFDPRNGQSIKIGEYGKGTVNFTTPGTAADWVLVLDDKATGFGPPGQ